MSVTFKVKTLPENKASRRQLGC